MVFFVLSAQFFLDNSHFFFHTHVVCRNFYRLRQAWQGWTRWYFIPLVIQNHEFFVTSSCLFLLFMSVQSSTVSVACQSAGNTLTISRLPKWVSSGSRYEPPRSKLASGITKLRYTVLLRHLPQWRHVSCPDPLRQSQNASDVICGRRTNGGSLSKLERT